MPNPAKNERFAKICFDYNRICLYLFLYTRIYEHGSVCVEHPTGRGEGEGPHIGGNLRSFLRTFSFHVWSTPRGEEKVKVLLESSVWLEGEDLLVLDFSLAMEQVTFRSI